MKKLIYGAMMLAAVAGMTACGSKKAAKKQPSGMVEDVTPMSGAKYHSDKDYFRAVQNGVSADRSIAQKIAMQNCRQELASNIQAELQLVIENYLNVKQLPSGDINSGSYQELAYTIVSQKMTDVQIVEEKTYRETENNQYRYYVCLQMPKAEIEKALEEALAKDEKINLEFDREQFRAIFESKIAK